MIIDVKKAHLYAPIEGDVYVDLPPERAKPGKCAKLKFTLYGMRPAAKNWENEYSGTLAKSGFEIGKGNGSSFYHKGRGVRIVVHGDDFVITGRIEDLEWTKGVLEAKYPLQSKGPFGIGSEDKKIAMILNRKVTWVENRVEFEADDVHVPKMLRDMKMESCNPVQVPGTADEPGGGDAPIEGGQAHVYRSVVARANYLAQDRPDIRYAVKELCRHMSQPSGRDWSRLKKLCRYLQGYPKMVQQSVEMDFGTIEVYVDSDFGGCRETRRSTSGGAMYAYGSCLKTWSVMQSGVARSSGEAELYAATKGMSEGLGMQTMARDVGIELEVVVHTDSDACRGTCQRTGLGRMKHLEVEALWGQDVLKRKRVRLERVHTDVNIADLMTKYLSRGRIEILLGLMGFVPSVCA